uniref:Uncharacterized protein n=1 Tax=Oryza glaberrima TaxID=4538 RepID=I1PQW9_ORYGL
FGCCLSNMPEISVRLSGMREDNASSLVREKKREENAIEESNRSQIRASGAQPSDDSAQMCKCIWQPANRSAYYFARKAAWTASSMGGAAMLGSGKTATASPAGGSNTASQGSGKTAVASHSSESSTASQGLRKTAGGGGFARIRQDGGRRRLRGSSAASLLESTSRGRFG